MNKMSENVFKLKIKEMILLEIENLLLEAEEPGTPMTPITFGGDEGTREPLKISPSAVTTKEEILSMFRRATNYFPKVGSKGKVDDLNSFLDFIKSFAAATKNKTYYNVFSLEDLADKIVKKYTKTKNWSAAKKEADQLTTKFVLSKDKDQENPEENPKEKQLGTSTESIFNLINRAMSPQSARNGMNKQQNIAAFIKWIKKIYPQQIDQKDDNITAVVKYAKMFSGTNIPSGKSVIGDLKRFFGTQEKPHEPSRLDVQGDEEEREIARAKSGGSYTTVTDVDGAMGVEVLSAQLGVSAPTIGNILAAIPPGKIKAFYDTLVAQVRSGHAPDAKRNIDQYSKLASSAIVSAQKEFILIIEDAIDKSPEDQLTLSALIDQLEELKLRKDMSSEEETAEDMFLNRIVEIVNDPEYANRDEWKLVVSEMLKSDLQHVVPVKNKDGKIIKTTNLVKSFQNLVSQAIGLLDPASRKLGAGAKSPGAERAQQIQNQEFPADYKIGSIGKTQRAPRAPRAGKSSDDDNEY